MTSADQSVIRIIYDTTRATACTVIHCVLVTFAISSIALCTDRQTDRQSDSSSLRRREEGLLDSTSAAVDDRASNTATAAAYVGHRQRAPCYAPPLSTG